MKTLSSPIEEETWYPLKVVHFDRGASSITLAAPLLRISACGLLRVEILVQTREHPTLEGCYRPLTEEQMRGRNGAQALTLLKLLISREHRHAPKSYLMEYLGHGEQAISEGRLDDLVTKLRGLICTEQWEHLRTHLIQHVHSSAATGNGYRLAAYPLIWLDIDALACCVEQAARLERHGVPELACSLWERASVLASRGDYLGDEEYADWAQSKRGEVARGRRASIHALSRLLVATAGEAGEAQALHLLSAYYSQYPLDEDVLRPLMELLGKHERFGEALALYEQACTLLSEEGLSPDEKTTDIAQVLRTKELHRQPSQAQLELPNERGLVRERISLFAASTPLMSEFATASGASLFSVAQFLYPALSLSANTSGHLHQYQEHLSTSWANYLTAPGQHALTTVEAAVFDLQRMAPYVRSTELQLLAELLCQYHQLAADQLRDRGFLSRALEHAHLAVRLAQQTQQAELLAAALYRRGFIFFDALDMLAARRDLNDALPFAKSSRASLQGMVCMEAGRFQAHLAQSQQDHLEALHLLDRTQSLVSRSTEASDAGYVHLNQGRYHIGRAATLLALGQGEQALSELRLAEQQTPQKYQRRHAYLNILRAQAYFSQAQFEQATHLASDAFHTCLMVYSQSNIAAILRLYRALVLSPFAKSPLLLQLGVSISERRREFTGSM